MNHYPFGTFPEKPAAWLVDFMESHGVDAAHAARLPMWHLDTAEDVSVPSVYLCRMPPGYVLFRHGHAGKRFEIIVQGTFELGDGQIAGVGDTLTAEPGEIYGPYTAGPEGCTTYEFCSTLDAMISFLYEDEDGSVRSINSLSEPMPPTYEPLPDYAEIMGDQ